MNYLIHFYLKLHISFPTHRQAIDLLFCYRWLLLEMKREFVFDEALRMLEVTWSSLPKYPRQNELGNLIFIRNELSFN
jgi:hypothetical protein